VRITALAAQESRSFVKIEIEVPPALSIAPTLFAANRNASRISQPRIAE
jgi:hypothetical protein